MGAPSEKNLIQSVSRAIAILQCFHDNRELSLFEISTLLGLHKSTTSGIVNTLKAENFLEQDSTHGKYKLGLEVFRLAMNSRLEFGELCEPHLETLSRLTGETINLGVYDGFSNIVYVSKKESIHSLKISTPLGSRLPMYCTAIGKAMLSVMEEQRASELIRLMDMKPLTDNTITDVQTLLDELDRIRQHGVAYDLEELELGLVCVAVPVYYQFGKPAGAISVSGPSLRMDEERRAYIGSKLREVSTAINNELCKA